MVEVAWWVTVVVVVAAVVVMMTGTGSTRPLVGAYDAT